MAAVIEIRSAHGLNAGNPATQAAVSSIRFKTADNDDADTSNPLVKPTSGTTYSYEKWLKLQVTQAPDNSLTNLRFHRSSGTFTGITDYYGFSDAYQQPSGSQSGVAINAVPTSATAVTQQGGGTVAAFSTTGQFGPWVVVQWRVGTTAVAGNQASVTYRFTFDES